MVATIQKEDSDGIKSTFTIIGSTIDDIDKQVYELQEFSRRNATYDRYGVLDYGMEKKNIKLRISKRTNKKYFKYGKIH